MTVSDFWNSAFLAALGRLPVTQAKAEADKATEVCVKHWQDTFPGVMHVPSLKKDMDITLVFRAPKRRASRN